MARKSQRPISAFRRVVLTSPDQAEGIFLARVLRQETVGGMLLLLAAVLAVGWANSPWQDVYFDLRHVHLGPLELEEWAADGLLTLFFFVVGVELKRELVVGALSRPADAMVPVIAAIAGMAMPALLYLAINIPNGDLRGWAIPTATDIAFALAVLAVVGTHLPSALRAFLLTLAVVDDLGAIIIIALVFTAGINLPALGVSLGLCAVYFVLQHFRVRSSVIYIPIAVATWWFMHESGIHATIAGVALGMLTRVRPDDDEHTSPAERLEHRLRPLSAGFAVPIYALAAAGVSLSGGLDDFTEPISIGIMVGLVFGKAIGVTVGAYLTTKLTHADLNPSLDWSDIFPVGVLAGIGFTVSLLITELAFDDHNTDVAKAAVLAGSVTAALLSAVLLRVRNRHYRKASEDEAAA